MEWDGRNGLPKHMVSFLLVPSQPSFSFYCLFLRILRVSVWCRFFLSCRFLCCGLFLVSCLVDAGFVNEQTISKLMACASSSSIHHTRNYAVSSPRNPTSKLFCQSSIFGSQIPCRHFSLTLKSRPEPDLRVFAELRRRRRRRSRSNRADHCPSIPSQAGHLSRRRRQGHPLLRRHWCG